MICCRNYKTIIIFIPIKNYLLIIYKGLFIYTTVLLYCVTASAQTIEEVKALVNKADYAVAKKTIDSYLSDNKNAAKPDGWYYKGFIYNECAKKDDLATLCSNCRLEAFDAFKKYQEKDPKNMYMILEQNVRLFDIYNGYSTYFKYGTFCKTGKR